MKVLGIVGSPRRGGNCDVLVQEVLKSARNHGAETEMLYLNDLKISSCQACEYCKEKEGCKQQDDMQIVYSKMHDADGVVVGSPIYMADISAQTKLMIDRMYAFFDANFRSRLPAGKRVVLIVTQQADDPKAFPLAMKVLKTGAEWMGIKVVGTIIGTGLGPKGAAAKNKSLLKKAWGLGKKLAQP